PTNVMAGGRPRHLGFVLSSVYRGQGPLNGLPRLVDLRLPAAEPEPAEGAEGDDLQEPDRRRLLRLVGADRGVAGRMDLEDVERLTLPDHVAVAHPVDELRLAAVDAGDDLRREDARLEPVALLQLHLLEDGLPGRADLALVVVVQLEQPV